MVLSREQLAAAEQASSTASGRSARGRERRERRAAAAQRPVVAGPRRAAAGCRADRSRSQRAPARRAGQRAPARRRRPPGEAAPTDPATPSPTDRRPWPTGRGRLGPRVAGGLAFLRRRLAGDYEVDEFGFDAELTDSVFLPLLRPLYQDWFRTEVTGVEHLPYDGAGPGGRQPLRHRRPRRADARRGAARRAPGPAATCGCSAPTWSSGCPCVSELARKSGGTVACNPDAERLLGDGELVGVFPEGFKGIGKPYADRYKLQRFGRGGFVSAALRTGTPIVPVAIVGAEEIYPMLADIKPLARLLKTAVLPGHPDVPVARAARRWCRCRASG